MTAEAPFICQVCQRLLSASEEPEHRQWHERMAVVARAIAKREPEEAA